MKQYSTPLKLLAIAFGLSFNTLSAQTLLYNYNFNDVDNTTSAVSIGSNTVAVSFNNSNTTRTANGGGVSGQSGDYALDLSSANGMGSSATLNTDNGASVSSAGGADGFNGSTSFTWTGWLNANSTYGSSARALQIGSYGAIIFNTTELSFNFRQSSDTGTTQTVTADSNLFNSTGSWVFFAATYDGTTGVATVYLGTTTDAVTEISSETFSVSDVYVNGNALNIGNSSSSNRPFDGLLDDYRVYTDGGNNDASGALNLSQLEAVRTSAIPESGTTALFTALSVLFLVALRRRKAASLK